jgi:hypothetical protein
MSLLKERSGLEREALEEAASLCRREGLNIIDTLVEKELLTEDNMKEILMESISTVLGDMLTWQTCRALFLPVTRPFDGNYSFLFEDVLRQADTKCEQQIQRL